jgi:hypothetical protein
MERGYKVPCILDIGTRQRSMVGFKLQPLYPWGEISGYPSERSRSESDSKEKHPNIQTSLLLPEI